MLSSRKFASTKSRTVPLRSALIMFPPCKTLHGFIRNVCFAHYSLKNIPLRSALIIFPPCKTLHGFIRNVCFAHYSLKNIRYEDFYCTFSIHLPENDQKIQPFSWFFSIELSPTCFERKFVHLQDVCTSSWQYFTMRLYEESGHWYDTVDISNVVSAIRLLIKMHGEVL